MRWYAALVTWALWIPAAPAVASPITGAGPFMRMEIPRPSAEPGRMDSEARIFLFVAPPTALLGAAIRIQVDAPGGNDGAGPPALAPAPGFASRPSE